LPCLSLPPRVDPAIICSKTAAATNIVRRGGSLIASIRTEPGSFNRYVHRDAGADLVSILTHAKLVRINKATQCGTLAGRQLERLGKTDGAFTLKLHPGVTFSDGRPLTADDVVFSFQAVYALGPEGPLGDALQVEGRRLEVAAVDASTVSIVFPVPYAPGVRILDNLPIYPKHRLEAALRAGKIHDAWGLSTPPSELAGLGPFVLVDYVPGQRAGVRPQPSLFPQGGRRHRAAVPGPGDRRDHAGSQTPSCCGSRRARLMR
jgi:peptide/nickel transport system substrate-binding protein